VTPHLLEREPCYILFKTDTKADQSDAYNWIALSYVPDHAPIRAKMLHAATRATLSKQLGDDRFVDSLYGTHPACPLP
jgi:twinfilin-like protein